VDRASRMMPMSRSPFLKFRTAGFPRYGFKAGLSGPVFPNSSVAEPAPGVPASRTRRARPPPGPSGFPPGAAPSDPATGCGYRRRRRGGPWSSLSLGDPWWQNTAYKSSEVSTETRTAVGGQTREERVRDHGRAASGIQGISPTPEARHAGIISSSLFPPRRQPMLSDEAGLPPVALRSWCRGLRSRERRGTSWPMRRSPRSSSRGRFRGRWSRTGACSGGRLRRQAFGSPVRSPTAWPPAGIHRAAEERSARAPHGPRRLLAHAAGPLGAEVKPVDLLRGRRRRVRRPALG